MQAVGAIGAPDDARSREAVWPLSATGAWRPAVLSSALLSCSVLCGGCDYRIEDVRVRNPVRLDAGGWNDRRPSGPVDAGAPGPGPGAAGSAQTAGRGGASADAPGPQLAGKGGGGNDALAPV